MILEEEKTSIDFLKKDMFEDIKSLVGHWTTTFGYRQSLIKDSKRQLQEILEQWECLEFSFSHVLVRFSEPHRTLLQHFSNRDVATFSYNYTLA